MKLLLFDIDGTILRTQGVGRDAFESVLEKIFGRPMTTEGVDFSGKTDPLILGDTFVRNGIDWEEGEARAETIWKLYTKAMRERLTLEHVRLLPGVQALIEDLDAQPNVRLGLITGNIEPMAYFKLETVGLAHYFPFGAFGSDHADRNTLAALAVERAKAHTGHAFTGKDIVVIGDTKHDIRCGRSIDAVAVGVCTGRISRDELAAHTPDLLLDDLSDPTPLLEHIFPAA